MTTTHLPLPPRRARFDAECGNQGLYFNKFFNQWTADFKKTVDQHSTGRGEHRKDFYTGKMSWVLSQIHGPLSDHTQFETKVAATNDESRVGHANDIARAARRMANLVQTLSGRPPVTFRATGPMLTGMGLSHPVENGFLWHHTLGVPYLPGSSVKGMIRAWAEHWCGETETARRLFGHGAKKENGHEEDAIDDDGPAAGCIVVFDALPVAPVALVAEIITPHDDGWRNEENFTGKTPSDWVSPTPIPFLAVGEGAEFQFGLAPRAAASDTDVETAYGLLADALEWIGAGAKTAVGFGRFGPTRIEEGHRVRVLDTHNRQEFHNREGIVTSVLGIGYCKVLLEATADGRKRAETMVKPKDLERSFDPPGTVQ